MCPNPTTDTIGDPKKLFWTPLKASDVLWNFEKFLIDKNGKPKYRIHRKITPEELQGMNLIPKLF